MRRRTLVVAGAVVLIAIGVAAFVVVGRDASYDRSFDTRVARPAYAANGPVVLFDEGHRNTHTTTTGYKPLADLLRSDGYAVRVASGPIDAATLHGVSVLVLAVARGANDANDQPAYADAEAAAVDVWVRAGGSVLLVTDHWPYGAAVASLAQRFDVTMGAGMVEDASHCDRERGESHLVFSTDNGLLRDHAIVRGRGEDERVRRVLTFTGQSVAGPSSAVAFLALSDAATERPPGPARVERRGGDVRVSMVYGEPASAAGRGQGLALEVGSGRLVVLGEAGMLRAQRERGGMLVGMNVPGYDDRQLALNVMHWLSRAI
jgi:hypothetical protein